MFSRIEICFVCARYKNKKSIEIAINGMLSERAGETRAEEEEIQIKTADQLFLHCMCK